MGAVKFIAVLLLCIPLAFMFRLMISNLSRTLKVQQIAEEEKKRAEENINRTKRNAGTGSNRKPRGRGKVIKYEDIESERRRSMHEKKKTYNESVERYRSTENRRNGQSQGRNRR